MSVVRYRDLPKNRRTTKRWIKSRGFIPSIADIGECAAAVPYYEGRFYPCKNRVKGGGEFCTTHGKIAGNVTDRVLGREQRSSSVLRWHQGWFGMDAPFRPQ